MLEKLTDNLAAIFLALLFSFSMVYASTTSMSFKTPVFFILEMIIVILLILTSLFHKKTIKYTLPLLGVIIVGLGFYTIYYHKLDAIYSFLEEYFYWMYDFIVYGGLTDKLYEMVTVIGLCVIFSIFSFFFIYKKFMLLPILLAGVTFFVVQWSYDYVLSMTPFYIFVVTILMCYIKFVHKKKLSGAPNEYVGNAPLLFWAIPFCLIVVLSANLVKADSKPLEWKWLDKKVNAVFFYFYRKFDSASFDYFSVASSGFGEKNSILGGRVKLNKTLVLTVETDKNVYLKGSAYDFYTGTKWTNSNDTLTSIKANSSSEIGLVKNDITEMNLGLTLLSENKKHVDETFYKTSVKVIYQNISTKSIFIPVKINSFSTKKDDLKSYLNFNEAFVSSVRLGKGFSYTVNANIPKRESPEFIAALQKSKRGLYEKAFKENKDLYILSEFIKNSDYYYSKYMQLPETLPQRVYDLAASLTTSYDNNYDKVKALEDFLSNEFPYNLDVRSTPRGRDFVDYFLFDLKEGYCTYYATALTVLSRCIGIPARYVEGYILPPKPTEKNPNLYYVTNQQAHAWTEVYFEGYGWLPFEATSPFRSRFYTSPEETATYSASFQSNPAFEDYMDMMRKYGNEGMNTPLDLGDLEVRKVPYLLYFCIGAGVIIALICILLIINNLRIKIKLYKTMNLPPKECVIGMYKFFMSVLSAQGYAIEVSETPIQYADRVDRYMYFNPVKFSAVTAIFVKTRYGAGETSDKEKQVLCEFHRSLMSETIINLGKLKFFIFRNVLGIV